MKGVLGIKDDSTIYLSLHSDLKDIVLFCTGYDPISESVNKEELLDIKYRLPNEDFFRHIYVPKDTHVTYENEQP